ncbi:MAG: DEAD/DEAH box helicase [Spirochaetia bacterium]|nr:DEAD/DEAH box helicase [Spirochaetia bacterium]
MEHTTETLFSDYPLSEAVLKAIEKKGFLHPSPVQEMILPRLLAEDTNIAVKARTGTGKTAAFGLPLVNKLTEPADKPQALILAPTRELALQISNEIRSLTTNRYPRITAVYGGASIGLQLRNLEKGTEIVVGTPGRVQDHIDRGSLDLSEIKYLILDEADEMLDMGFIDDVKKIIDAANPDKKVALFSATLPAPIMKIVDEQLGKTEIIAEDVPEQEEILVNQEAILLKADDRLEALKRIVDSTENFHGLVFCPTKIEADEVARRLMEDGYPAEALHGNLSQEARERTLRRFKNKLTTILIATDVAARGIDVERLTHVINWELPHNFDSYIHRIGRTGRAGEKGTAISFIRPTIRYKIREYNRKSENVLGSSIKVVKVPEIMSILAVRCQRLEKTLETKDQEYRAPGGNQKEKDIIAAFADKLIATMGAGNTVKALLASAYGDIFDTERYRDIEQIEEPKRKRDRDNPWDRKRKGKDFEQDDWQPKGRNRKAEGFKPEVKPGTVRLHIGWGKDDNIGPRELVKFLAQLLKIKGSLIDDVSIKGNFSFATVPEKAGLDAVEKSRKNPELPTITLAHQDKPTGPRKGRDKKFDRSKKQDWGKKPERKSRKKK